MKLRALSSVVVVAAVAVVSSACGRSSPCPKKFSDLPPAKQGAADLSCTCNASNLTGSVWGSGTYTTDSSICAAAIHAGAIPATGGVAKPKKAAGCKQYVGAAANGVTTSGWGSFDSSFFFPGHGDGACTKIGDGGICPPKFKDADAPEMTCTCDAAMATGTVWGNGIYTTDSSVCAAAVHAGAIPATGGKVHAKKTQGCPAYAGSAANGVTSTTWGSFEASFYFPDKGDGKCGGAPTGDPEAACPTAFRDIPNAAAVTTFTCKCPGGKHAGSVWGTGTYTRDSSICGAAVHVGAIPTTGGKVTVKPSAGCPKYKGSLGHGVMSSNWGSFDGSFFFVGNGDGSCH